MAKSKRRAREAFANVAALTEAERLKLWSFTRIWPAEMLGQDDYDLGAYGYPGKVPAWEFNCDNFREVEPVEPKQLDGIGFFGVDSVADKWNKPAQFVAAQYVSNLRRALAIREKFCGRDPSPYELFMAAEDML